VQGAGAARAAGRVARLPHWPLQMEDRCTTIGALLTPPSVPRAGLVGESGPGRSVSVAGPVPAVRVPGARVVQGTAGKGASAAVPIRNPA
jgi:hypothetical protein